MKIILFDTAFRTRLFPLTSTRAVADIRMGILTIKERWGKITGSTVYVFTEEYLQPLYETIPGDNYLFVDACVLPAPEIVQRILNLDNNEGISDENGLIAGKTHVNSLPAIDELTTRFKNVSSVPAV